MGTIYKQKSKIDRRCRQKSPTRQCLICGKDFRAIHDFKNRKQKYCGKECWSKRNPPIIKECGICRKEFITYKRSKKYCSFKCRNRGMTGRKLPETHCENISKSKKGKLPKNHWRSGELHPMWNPNRTDQRERFTKKYIDWKFAVIKRDKFTCQLCGDKRSSGKKFCVDHIKAFSEYPELRFETSNGRVLCVDCHRKTETYCKKSNKAIKL